MSRRPELSPRFAASAWTLASGCVTLLMAALALALPDVERTPKGGFVGWLLVAAGSLELAFGVARGPDRLRVAATVSGIMTALAGVIFVANPSMPYFSVAYVVTVWLGIRGAWIMVMARMLPRPRTKVWLGISGVTDLMLALALAAGFPSSMLVVTLFGPTPYIVAQFSLILATSFLVTGVSQIALSRIEP